MTVKIIPNNYFSILPCEIRYSDLADFSKLLWAEIYVNNWMGKFNLTNKELADALNRSPVQVSRAIAELYENNMVFINGERSQRRLAVSRYSLQLAIKPKTAEPLTVDNEERRKLLFEFLDSLKTETDLIGSK